MQNTVKNTQSHYDRIPWESFTPNWPYAQDLLQREVVYSFEAPFSDIV